METQVQDERRKYPRFSDRILAGASVQLSPCPPLYGEAASGYLIDLSAGGMAILLSDLIPKNVFLKMTMTLPDGFEIQSVVTVRRVLKQGNHNDYVHGIEFLNPAPEMIERIEAMAKEILACNKRTQQHAPEICVSSCSLRKICKRPQCIEKNVRPALIEFTEALKSTAVPAAEVLIEATSPKETVPPENPNLPEWTTVSPDEVEKFFSEAA